MRVRRMLFAWMIGLGANSYAASEPIPLDLIEWLGEVNSDIELEQAMTEIEQQGSKPTRQTTSDKPQPSATGGNKQ